MFDHSNYDLHEILNLIFANRKVLDKSFLLLPEIHLLIQTLPQLLFKILYLGVI